MARTDEQELAIRLEAKIADFERSMDRAQKKANTSFNRMERDAAQSATKLERSFARAGAGINRGLAGIGKGLATRLAPLAVIGAAGLLGKSFLEKTLAQEKAVASVEAVIKSTGGVAGVTSKAAQELAASLQKVTTFGDEAILPAQALLLTFTKIGKDVFPDATKIVLDMSEALGQDLKSSAIQVGKALNDPVLGVSALRRVGVSFSASQQKVIADLAKTGKVAEAQKLILRELQTEFGGAAVAARDTLGGALKALGNAFGDAFELHGPEVDGLREKIEELIVTVSDPRFTNAMADIGQSLFTAMQNIAAAVVTIDEVIGRTSTGLDGLGKKLADFGNSSFFKQLNDVLGYNDPAFMKANGITPTRNLQTFNPDARVANAFDLTVGTGIPEASKAGRIVDEGAKDAKTSLTKLSTAVDEVSDNISQAAGRGMLDLIGAAEGTDAGRGYNETLARGKFTNGDRNLVFMSLDQIDKLQTKMLQHPDNTYNSSALGRFQIVQKTLRGLRGELGLKGSDIFSPEMQDRLAMQLLRRRGGDVGGLRNEWEGLRRIDDDTIRSAYNDQTIRMPALDAGVADKRDTAAEKAAGYHNLVAQSKAFTAEQGMERQALGMTAEAAAKLRYEQQLLNEAQQAGIALTPQQRAQIGALAAQMAEAETSVTDFAQAQADAQAVADEWRDFASGTLKGFVSDLRQGKSAGEAFGNVLSRIADKLIDMAINSLFENAFPTGGGGGGGGIGGIFGVIGKLFGFASGGHVSGPGTGTSDSIPARLSDGEFVVRASATKKHGRLLEAINADRVPAFASGGMVSPTPMSTPSFGSSGSRGGGDININSAVTINASGGTPEQNADLAKQTQKAVDAQMRAIVQQELRQASRPGGGFR